MIFPFLTSWIKSLSSLSTQTWWENSCQSRKFSFSPKRKFTLPTWKDFWEMVWLSVKTLFGSPKEKSSHLFLHLISSNLSSPTYPNFAINKLLKLKILGNRKIQTHKKSKSSFWKKPLIFSQVFWWYHFSAWMQISAKLREKLHVSSLQKLSSWPIPKLLNLWVTFWGLGFLISG